MVACYLITLIGSTVFDGFDNLDCIDTLDRDKNLC